VREKERLQRQLNPQKYRAKERAKQRRKEARLRLIKVQKINDEVQRPLMQRSKGVTTMTKKNDEGFLGFTKRQVEENGIKDVLNKRNWLEKLLSKEKVTVKGSGIGFGQGDIDVEIDGRQYTISIRPCRT
jgi:hypothetical protein